MSIVEFLGRGLIASQVGSSDDDGEGWQITDNSGLLVAAVLYIQDPPGSLDVTDYVAARPTVNFPLNQSSKYVFDSLGAMDLGQFEEWADSNFPSGYERYSRQNAVYQTGW